MSLKIKALIGLCWLSACTSTEAPITTIAYSDHSFARPHEAAAVHLDLKLTVDTATKTLCGSATYAITTSTGAKSIVFDTRQLLIKSVLVDGKPASKWWLGEAHEIFGAPLEIAISDQTKQVSIEYCTSPEAPALQWLKASQTTDKQHPFLFTQSQAILARSWLPAQDAPGQRFTYEAQITCPAPLMAVMSATNGQTTNTSGTYKFSMTQPIPAYLMALAVGRIDFLPLDGRSGVYAEPSVVAAAQAEFAALPAMISATESLYGPYAWQRYDVLVLPSSFPFGGMENPKLTFLTPTIIAGDGSLTSLLAHELAHSWSGNLVTNATWEDFWLNEGFTVYLERRIMESLYGADYAAMLSVLGRQDLEHTLQEFRWQPDETKLKLELTNRDPDEGLTDIAYEKGFLFLKTIEAFVGREAFDDFLKKYFTHHAFGTITTEQFEQYLKANLLDGSDEKMMELKVREWLYGPHLPSNAWAAESSSFDAIELELDSFVKSGLAIDTAAFTTHHWLHFLRSASGVVNAEQMAQLDQLYGFTKSNNSEIAFEWFKLSLATGYTEARPAIEKFLLNVGRRKFTEPLYAALATNEPDRLWAIDIYERAKSGYHSITRASCIETLKLQQP